MRGYAAIGLYNPRTPANVGSALRAATCYSAAMLAMTGDKFKHASTDTCNSHLHIPLIETADLFSVLPHGCVPVAIEFISTASSLPTYKHPERAFYIFGPEGSSLNSSILNKCRDVVMVPTMRCMNLAACVNVVLYDRLLKQLNRQVVSQ